MKLLIANGKKNTVLWICLNVLRWIGFLVPDELTAFQKTVKSFYSMLWFMFIVGIITIAQFGDLLQVLENVPLMVETSYLLFTCLVYIIKIINLFILRKEIFDIVRDGDEELNTEEREEGKAIIERSNRDMIRQMRPLIVYAGSAFSWGVTEDRTLLFRAWYPVDVTKSPAYEIAYVHQSLAVTLLALTNGSFDTMVISLVAVCRCRIRLLQLTLRNLFEDIEVNGKRLLSDDDNRKVAERLRACIIKHQAILESGFQIRTCFSYSILAQFTVSIVILCVSAYQVGEVELDNKLRLVFMIAYLLSMAVQVFVYCYQGNCISEESVEIADTLYEMPWYVCSLSIRKTLLVMMVRSRRPIELTAGGFATLSLGCFMSIIKVSYSFFTVLRQVEE
uniref:Odorant receptor n=1 Tax=Dendrolimus kikuchii TaxID=765133 RepID=A0A076E7N6_9NEOP|nr:odorant receptor [Dendrolimus kikuchii]